jgi:hypothetical protein
MTMALFWFLSLGCCLALGFKVGQWFTREAAADGLSRMLEGRTDADELMKKFVGPPTK